MTQYRPQDLTAAADPGWRDEQTEWLDALDAVLRERGPDAARELLERLHDAASRAGLVWEGAALNTPYVNTIPLADEPEYPGDLALEQRLENIIRWNAAAMVLQAYDSGSGVGGHIATYFSAATMLEVGLNHHFRGPSKNYGGDMLNAQAHAAPGIYARAFLEGRLTAAQLGNFRRELGQGGGLPSYPHPRRLPEFWQMPTASMGLSTPSSIYMARFSRYLEHRGLKPANGGKIWTFIGDGESDEPEVLGTINIASREHLDNLVLVVNCNLQRLDGPVRGNGKIIQELERSFRGADWHVIKVIWGGGWDPLLARDSSGLLRQRMEDAVDGDYQFYSVSPGNVQREHWVEDIPELRDLMKTLSDEELRTIRRGGHDPRKIHAAFSQAQAVTGKPVVVLLKTVKGDGMGPRSEGSNTVHQKKNLSPEDRQDLAKRFGIPLDSAQARAAQFYRPPEDSPEMLYLRKRRDALGGSMPRREVRCPTLAPPNASLFSDMVKGSGERKISTTMAVVRMLAKLLRHKELGKFIVPIVPDEARTFGMDGLFPQAGIYSPAGQTYEPVDAGSIAPYREAADGQILQEGICETGAMASFLAAGTAYANHGVPTIPFYIFYSMFGFQRVGDMIWACGDMMARGFLLGGTSGRTTLNGEGVQHQDGHSLLHAATVPNLLSYDPAFAYELAVVIREGIRRMYQEHENVFYYLTVGNQNQLMPAMPGWDADQPGELPATVVEGILRGIHRYREQAAVVGGAGGAGAGSKKRGKKAKTPHANLLGSGAIMVEADAAAGLLAELGVASTLWSVTSYTELTRDAHACERHNRLQTGEQRREPFVQQALGAGKGVYVAASDYMRALPEGISRWVPGPWAALGTDGFGLSEDRQVLRTWFEVSAPWIAWTALCLLADAGEVDAGLPGEMAGVWGLDLGKGDPAVG